MCAAAPSTPSLLPCSATSTVDPARSPPSGESEEHSLLQTRAATDWPAQRRRIQGRVPTERDLRREFGALDVEVLDPGWVARLIVLPAQGSGIKGPALLAAGLRNVLQVRPFWSGPAVWRGFGRVAGVWFMGTVWCK